MFFSSMLDS